MASLLLRILKIKNKFNYISAYITYVRPLIEYNTNIWNPYLITDIKLIESVQRRYTRIVCNKLNLKFSTYSERLEILNIESLEYRRVKSDVVLMYKIYNLLVHINFDAHFSKHVSCYNLRRHSCSLEVS